MALTQTQVSQLYTALLGRASEGNGSVYWQTHYSDMTVAAEAMLGSTAVANYFGDALDSDFGFVTTLYANTLNKTVNGAGGTIEDLAGITYWTNQLESGAMTRAEMMVSFINRVVEIQNTAPTVASQQFTNRVDVSNYTADNVASAPADYATSLAFHNAGASTGLVVTNDLATVTTAEAAVDAVTVVVGQTYPLTTGIDTITGTTGNDVINATDTTATALDTINGGTGVDTLTLNDINGTDFSAISFTVANIETANVRAGAAGLVVDSSAWTGLTALNVTQALDVDLTAAATTAVSVSGATTTIDIDGGSTQTVTSSGNGAVTLLNAAGAVSVTHSDMQADIIVTDGTNVSVTVTASDAVGDIIVGEVSANAATDATKNASGTVVVTATNNTTAATANANLDASMSDIYVDGGSTITVTQATSATDAATNTTGGTVTQGDVLIAAGATTTTVSVSQTATVAEAPYVAAIAAVSATSTVTFGLMAAAGDSVTVNNLTFTAAKALTAAEVAAAFANLSLADLQASGGIVENGIFTGISNTTPWTSGAATGASVTFSAVAGTATPLLANTGTAVLPTATVATAGTAAGAVTPGVLGVATGTVNILDTAATATITTVTVDGYKTGSSIGVNGANETQKANALTTLSLANSDAAAVFAVATASTSLDLTVNNVNGTLNLDATGTNGVATTNTVVATLDVTTATAASTIALQADAVTDLTVAGTKTLTLTGSSLDALETVTVTGSASLVLAGQDQTVLTSVTTTGTTGTVTATIDADIATYTGGAGVDNVTLSTSTVDKAVNLGAGNNTLTLASGTTALTSEMIAGAGTDTLVMASANAATATTGTTFETKITGFEKLSLGAVAAAATDSVDLANMDDISYVISAGSAANTTETGTYTFGALTDGQSITVAGVTVQAIGGNLTGLQVAESFDNAANGATPVAGHANAKVTGTLTGWSTADTTAATVVFTSSTASSNVADLDTTDAVAGIAAKADVLGAQGAQGDAAGTSETATVVLGALAAGQSYTVVGLKIQALSALTATQAGDALAAAFGGGTSTATYLVSGAKATPTNWGAGYTVANAAGTLTFTNATDANIVTTATDFNATGNLIVAAPTIGAQSAYTQGISAAASTLTLTNMADNGTLELTAAGGATVTMKDATSTTADIFNIVTKVNAADISFGTVAVAGVETVNITATDTTPVNTTTGAATISKATMTLSDAAVKSVVITGEADLDLTAAGASLTSVNASAFTGKLTFSSAVASATITGGSAADTLTATGTSQTLTGGNGADTLNAGNLTTLIGGAGADKFVVNIPTNVNSYSTITDLRSGDVIQLTAGESFASTALTLASTAVFQDYANAAANKAALDNVDNVWFQYSGNTYIVANDDQTDATNANFENGIDGIIQITGLVNLGTGASYNQTNGTLEIA